MGKIKFLFYQIIRLIKFIASNWPIDLKDIFVFGGCALLGDGLYQIYQPIAYIVVGVSIMGIGLFYGKLGSK